MEKFLLGRFLARYELDVVDEQYVRLAVFAAEKHLAVLPMELISSLVKASPVI